MKISEYAAIDQFTDDNVMLVDGTNGTKKILLKDALLAAMDLLSPVNHRLVFRGKNLGTSLTTTQKAAIQNGTFKDLWLGDYWVINDTTWRIADIDYWYNCGDNPFTNHHLVIMPDASMYSVAMGSTNSTEGGYVGSTLYASGLTNAKTAVTSAFGDAVLTHREYLVNAVTNGVPSSGGWYDSTVELPNENMMYGHPQFSPTSDGSITSLDYVSSKTQLALFAASPQLIIDRTTELWLRDVVSTSSFALIGKSGRADKGGASGSHGIRPVFAIG